MIQLKVSRTNSIYGSWKCEEMNNKILGAPIGISDSIEDAIGDFLRSFWILNGYDLNDYKWC